jgi:hypothetical protein
MHSCYLAKLLRIGYSFYSVCECCRDVPEDLGFVCDKAAALRDSKWDILYLAIYSLVFQVASSFEVLLPKCSMYFSFYPYVFYIQTIPSTVIYEVQQITGEIL